VSRNVTSENYILFHISKKQCHPLILLNSIYAKNVQTIFLNVFISVGIFYAIPGTVTVAERSFSNLGNSLKTWQRSTTNQEQLNSLALLSMENELASTINFDDIITEFVELKAHKIKCQLKKNILN
jgi:hypothetical protein